MRAAAAVLTSAAVLASGAFAAVPAAASSPSYRFGIKWAHQPVSTAATSANTLILQTSQAQGAVSPNPLVYLVFWGSQWSSDPASVQTDLPLMFQGLFGAQDTWGTILNQYCEGLPKGTTNCGAAGTHVQHPAASPLGGVWADTSAAEPAKATGAQLAAEAVKAAAHFGNTTQASNVNSQYVIASAHGLDPDTYREQGYCAYHGFAGVGSLAAGPSPYGNLSFTNLPYVPDLGVGGCTTLSGRLLDGIESTETHEYAEAVTDLWPAAGWNTSTGSEIGDICASMDARVTLSTGSFDLQGLWSNDKNACVTSEPGTTPPPPMPSGPPQSLAGTALGGGSAAVSWSAPASNGGSPVTFYYVLGYSAASASFVPGQVVSATSATFTGLTPNSYYTFIGSAWNGVGWSSYTSWSAWVLVT